MKDYIMSTFSVLSIWNVLWPNCMMRSIPNWLVFFMLFLPTFSALNYQSLWILIVTLREPFQGFCIIFCWIVCRSLRCKVEDCKVLSEKNIPVKTELLYFFSLLLFPLCLQDRYVDWKMQFHCFLDLFKRLYGGFPHSIWRNN